jgi:Tc5 transposase DNA-binding domain
MPIVRTKSTPEEGRITKAIDALRSGEQESVLSAHKAFNVPYRKLLGRFAHGKEASHGGQNKALDDAQEEALLQYIDHCSESGRPAKRQDIINGANSILWSSGQFIEVSHSWVTRYIVLYSPIYSYSSLYN